MTSAITTCSIHFSVSAKIWLGWENYYQASQHLEDPLLLETVVWNSRGSDIIPLNVTVHNYCYFYYYKTWPLSPISVGVWSEQILWCLRNHGVPLPVHTVMLMKKNYHTWKCISRNYWKHYTFCLQVLWITFQDFLVYITFLFQKACLHITLMCVCVTACIEYWWRGKWMLSRKLVHLNMMYLYMKVVFFENCVE